MVTRMSPGFGGGELRQRPFRAVERPDADPRPAFEPERDETGGQRIDTFGEFRPRPPDIMAWRNQRFAAGPAPSCQIEAAPDGVAQQRRIGDTANITRCYFGQACSSMRRSTCQAHLWAKSDGGRLPARPDRSRRERPYQATKPPSAPHRARHRRRVRSRQRLPGTSCPRTAAAASGSHRPTLRAGSIQK